MRALLIGLAASILAAAPALSASTSGPYALALAALVAERDPFLSATDRRVVAALFSGNERVAYPAGRRVPVRADRIVCRVSNVQITSRSCQLSFRGRSVNLSGAAANARFSTLAAAGVPADGAAGSIFEAVHGVACTLTPSLIKQNGGGGASCAFSLGP